MRDDLRVHVFLVHGDEETAGEGMCGISAIKTFGVVEHRKGHVCGVAATISNIVLTPEHEVVPFVEIVQDASQAPYYVSVVLRYLVNGVRMAARVDVVALVGFVDRIRVAVILFVSIVHGGPQEARGLTHNPIYHYTVSGKSRSYTCSPQDQYGHSSSNPTSMSKSQHHTR